MGGYKQWKWQRRTLWLMAEFGGQCMFAELHMSDRRKRSISSSANELFPDKQIKTLQLFVSQKQITGPLMLFRLIWHYTTLNPPA